MDIIEDREGNLWFSTKGGGVSRYDGDNWVTYTTEDGLVGNFVFSMIEDSKGNLWFGCGGQLGGGVSRFDGEEWVTFTTKDGLAADDLRTIFEDRAGNIWFGTWGGGVSRYDGESWITYTTEDGLSAEEIAYLVQTMSELGLTEEEEAAFRLAVYGHAGRASLPKAFCLEQNHPNPFNPSTAIVYAVPEGKTVQVRLAVYDLRGRLVRLLVNEVKEAGEYQVYWDGADSHGRNASSGVYFYRIQAGDFVQTRKMVQLK